MKVSLKQIKNLLTVGSLIKIRVLSINKDTWFFHFEDFEGVLVKRCGTKEGLVLTLKSKIMGIVINYTVNIHSPNMIGLQVIKKSILKIKGAIILNERS